MPGTLMINGTVDWSTPLERVRDFKKYFKNGHLVVLAEYGHSGYTKLQPEAFQHLVSSYYLKGTVDDSKFKYNKVKLIR